MNKHRVALISGGSRGIGAETAFALADAGLRVAVVGRNQEALDQVCRQIADRGGEARSITADLSQPEQTAGIVDRVVETWGRLDVLVNNAGVLPEAKRAHELSADEFSYVHTVNLVSPWLLACRARDVMVTNGGGLIVNVTSTAAHYPTVGLVHYNSSKAALTMVTRALAQEWARDAIRVIGVAPGRIDTDMVRPIVDYDTRKGRQPNPLNRLGTPAEVASLIAYLATPAAAYITGTVLTIDGGELLSVPTS